MTFFSMPLPFVKKTRSLNTIEISRENILHNFALYQSIVGDKYICPVLKSNAYGHGIQEVAGILQHENFPYFLVDSYYEALRIREVTRGKDVLIMGYTHSDNYAYFDFSSLIVTVYDKESIHVLGKLQKKIRVHLMINTGMHREGIRPTELKEYVELIRTYPLLVLDGVYSHFADADNTDADDSFTQSQMKNFSAALDTLESLGDLPPHIHIANSAGVLKVEDTRITMYRLGLGLYGYHTVAERDVAFSQLVRLLPALRFLSTVTNIVHLKKGEKVSYNGTFTAAQDMTIGVAAVGYYECLNRSLSNKGFFKSGTTDLPIIGRVCMNLTCFDTKEISLGIGDCVEIIGQDPQARNSVYALAEDSGTIPYEILVNLSESTRRVVV